MSLMDAPAYDPRRDRRNRNLLIAASVLFGLLLVLTVAGYGLGHGWLFSNLPAERRVDKFFTALEQKDYAKAYGIYYNDPNWQQHPQKYAGYPLAQFTDDWTTDPRVFPPIKSHHVDISRTDGSGTFGSGIIVAVRVNLQDGVVPPADGEEPHTWPGHKLFMYVIRADGSMTWPAPHVLEYNP